MPASGTLSPLWLSIRGPPRLGYLAEREMGRPEARCRPFSSILRVPGPSCTVQTSTYTPSQGRIHCRTIGFITFHAASSSASFAAEGPANFVLSPSP